ncbi:MAG: CocE/NonD family hydrolase, partial [Candidatus Binatia bacterium]
DEYVSITASVRGTGCSSGEFDVFSETSAIDGYHVIEWAAAQEWSNGDVGLFGHSYSGITAALVAATQPPHLRVASISGLIGDVFRDIVYPGGVSNYGFPLIWTGGYRPFTDVAGGTLGGLLADTGDRRCLQNQAARSRTILGEPIVNGLQDWDGPWYQARSVVYKADAIQVPTHVTSAYQDEQTGPRGGTNVFDHLTGAFHKRLVLLNGDHNAQAQLPETIAERKAWLDYWLLGRESPFVDPLRQPTSVRVLLEVHEFEDGERSNGEITSSDFPLTQTDWTDWYLHEDGGLSTTPPAEDEGSTVYFNGSKRQAYAYQAGVNSLGELTSIPGPDEAFFRSEPFAEPMVIAGPITATLFMRALPADLPLPLPTDLEVMVQVLDEGPGGELTYLQRGVLRASHREIDPARSQLTNEDRIYRPYRPHAGPIPDLILMNQIYELFLDVYPVGHVFRPGHRLAIKVHAPSLDDNDWIYVPKSPPALVTLFHDAAHPSSVMLPVIPTDEVDRLGEDLGRCASSRVRCVEPAAALPSADDLFGALFD